MRVQGDSGIKPNTANTTSDEARRLQEACRQFEAVFYEIMLKEMRKTVPEDGLLKKGLAEDVFQSMYDEELARSMSSRGQLGLAKLLYEQMRPRGKGEEL